MSDQSDEPLSWSAEHRRWVKARIDDAAARARAALGAHDVLMVAWFQDLAQPTVLHWQDGGTAPWPPDEVYQQLMRTVVKRKAVLAINEVIDEPGSSTVQ